MCVLILHSTLKHIYSKNFCTLHRCICSTKKALSCEALQSFATVIAVYQHPSSNATHCFHITVSLTSLQTLSKAISRFKFKLIGIVQHSTLFSDVYKFQSYSYSLTKVVSLTIR